MAILVNSSPLDKNNFKYIFVNEKFYIVTKIAPKFVPRGPVDNKG